MNRYEKAILKYLEKFLIFHGIPKEKVSDIMFEYHRLETLKVLREIDKIFDEYFSTEEDLEF